MWARRGRPTGWAPAPTVNAYLVRESDGFTLVDTTLGGPADALIAPARAEGGEIVRIALMHGHSDHAGDTFTSYWRTEVPNRVLQPFPLAAMGTQDRRQVVDSARAALRLEPAVLVTGHGPAVRGPGPAMDSALARAALRGFVVLEEVGGFAIDLPIDESFDRLLATLDAGLRKPGGER